MVDYCVVGRLLRGFSSTFDAVDNLDKAQVQQVALAHQDGVHSSYIHHRSSAGAVLLRIFVIGLLPESFLPRHSHHITSYNTTLHRNTAENPQPPLESPRQTVGRIASVIVRTYETSHTYVRTTLFTLENINAPCIVFSRAFPDRRRWECSVLLSDEGPTPCPSVGRGGVKIVAEHTHDKKREETAKEKKT